MNKDQNHFLETVKHEACKRIDEFFSLGNVEEMMITIEPTVQGFLDVTISVVQDNKRKYNAYTLTPKMVEKINPNMSFIPDKSNDQ